MIVREILNDDFDMDKFDWYNDGTDTMMWLRSMAKYTRTNCPHCGCTEMLCGHNGPGCEKEEN